MILKALALLCFAAATSGQRRYYSLHDMPETNFDCRDKILGGYYADPETNCQMFHVCVKIPGQGVQDFRFLCPNETVFDQENQICADSGDIDCEAAGLYLENFDLYRIGSAPAKRPLFTSSKGTVVPLGPSTKSPILTNNINEDDEFYLQRSETGDRRLHSKDLLRGSSSSNFFNNRNKGKDLEDDDDDEAPKNVNEHNPTSFKSRPNHPVRGKSQYSSQFRRTETTSAPQTTAAEVTQPNVQDKKRTKIAVRKLTKKRPQTTEAVVENKSTPNYSTFTTQVTQKFSFGEQEQKYNTINRQTTPSTLPTSAIQQRYQQNFRANTAQTSTLAFFEPSPTPRTNDDATPINLQRQPIVAAAAPKYQNNQNVQNTQNYQQKTTTTTTTTTLPQQTKQTTQNVQSRQNFQQGRTNPQQNFQQSRQTPQPNNFNSQPNRQNNNNQNFQQQPRPNPQPNNNQNFQQPQRPNPQPNNFQNRPNPTPSNNNNFQQNRPTNNNNNNNNNNNQNFQQPPRPNPQPNNNQNFQQTQRPNAQPTNFQNRPNPTLSNNNNNNNNNFQPKQTTIAVSRPQTINNALQTRPTASTQNVRYYNRNFDDFEDQENDNQEFLKTAPSNNFRPSDLNSFKTNFNKNEISDKNNVTKGVQTPTTKYYTPTIITTPKTSPTFSPDSTSRQVTFQSTNQPSSVNYYTPTVTSTTKFFNVPSSTLQPPVSGPQPRPFSTTPNSPQTSGKPAADTKDASYDYAYYDDAGSFSEYDALDALGETDFSRTSQRTKSRLI